MSFSNTFDNTISGSTATSYVSLDEANTYFSVDLPFYQDWDVLTDSAKESWLMRATRQLDSLPFISGKKVSTQSLQFPRWYQDVQDEIPIQVKQAQCELAKIMLSTLSTTSSGQQAKEISSMSLDGVGSIVFAGGFEIDQKIFGANLDFIYDLLSNWLPLGFGQIRFIK